MNIQPFLEKGFWVCLTGGGAGGGGGGTVTSALRVGYWAGGGGGRICGSDPVLRKLRFSGSTVVSGTG